MSSEKQPLVSIICLCYNHEEYVEEALDSVLKQTYPHIQLIVVDDASTDNSQAVIKKYLAQYPSIPFLALAENVGSCKAFNTGWALAKGEWILDFAADDRLLPHRIERQIAFAQSLPNSYGVLFSDAWLINSQGIRMKGYYRRDKQGVLQEKVPQGWVYPQLLRQAFICSPTMLYRQQMMLEINGYNEHVNYEDYDLWVRSGKHWQYGFQDEILMERRVLPTSLGAAFYKKRQNENLSSTLKICQYATMQVTSPVEKKALAHSVRYHLRQSVWMECKHLIAPYLHLLQQLEEVSMLDRVLALASRLPLPWYWMYRKYLKWRYRIG